MMEARRAALKNATMKTTYYLCDKFGKYVAVTGDGFAVLIDGYDIAEQWADADEAQQDSQAFSFALGTEVRVVAHCE